MVATFSKSMNSVHALVAQLRRALCDPLPVNLEVFGTHIFPSSEALSRAELGWSGISWITFKKVGASSNGTQNAKVVSCEIGEKGFEVEGKD